MLALPMKKLKVEKVKIEAKPKEEENDGWSKVDIKKREFAHEQFLIRLICRTQRL